MSPPVETIVFGTICSYCETPLTNGMHVLIEPTSSPERFKYCCVDCMPYEEITKEDGKFCTVINS